MLQNFPKQKEFIRGLASLNKEMHDYFIGRKRIEGISEDPYHPYYNPHFEIYMYPDTNIELDLNARKYFTELSKRQGFHYDILPIIRHEKEKGGLGRKFGALLPKDLARGQSCLEQRCNINNERQRSIYHLFDIIGNVFDTEVELIYSVSNKNPNLSNEGVAQLVQKQNKKQYVSHKDYSKFVSKLVGKYRDGNLNNYIADKILVSTTFGFNLASYYNKSMIISNDADIDFLFEVFYSEILPTYLAETTIKTIKKMGDSVPIDSKNKYLSAVREHMEWAKSTDPTFNQIIGLMFVPNDNKFYFREVASAFTKYFEGLEDYRIKKSNMISEMVRTGKSPDDVISYLFKQ